MPATRLVLTVLGTACAATLVVPAALSSGATTGSDHIGHAAVWSPPAGSERMDGPSLRTAAASNRAARLPRIRGYVGADATFTISKRRVPKGRYRLVVKDQATTHNWHIEGRGVDRSTTLDGTGKWVWRVRLRKGTYTLVCDAHPASMKTSLKVTSG